MSQPALAVIPKEPERPRNPALVCVTALALLGATLGFVPLASAQSGGSLADARTQLHDMRLFAPLYEGYARAAQQHGAAALKEVAQPDLVLKGPGGTLRGTNAIREHGKVLDFFKGAAVAVKFWSLRVRGSTATAMVEESAKERDGKDFSMTLTWDWKHTWRKTPDGWKLARIERTDIGPDKAHPTVSFTVTAGETK